MTDRKEEYAKYLESSTWKQLSKQAKERDGKHCRLCYATNTLVVHHSHYPETFGTESLDWLITLCAKCHDMFHGNRSVKHTKKPSKQNRHGMNRAQWKAYKREKRLAKAREKDGLSPSPQFAQGHILRKANSYRQGI